MISVFFDLETAGLLPTHPIIQLAAVAVDEETWTPLATFERKLQFDVRAADADALTLNGYTPEAWSDALTPAMAVMHFSKFLEPFKAIEFISKRTGRPFRVARLIGHNAATFDGPRLKALYEQCKAFLPADPRVLCTCQRAMWWFAEHRTAPKDYKLETLCAYFGLPTPTHDALADVRSTIALAERLRSPELPQQGGA